MNTQDIRNEIIEENLFQHKSKSSAKSTTYGY